MLAFSAKTFRGEGVLRWENAGTIRVLRRFVFLTVLSARSLLVSTKVSPIFKQKRSTQEKIRNGGRQTPPPTRGPLYICGSSSLLGFWSSENCAAQVSVGPWLPRCLPCHRLPSAPKSLARCGDVEKPILRRRVPFRCVCPVLAFVFCLKYYL